LQHLLETPEFNAIERRFDPKYERSKIEYWRFWHEMAHALNVHFDIHPVDDQSLKAGMDGALSEGKNDVANKFFLERSRRSGDQLSHQETPGRNRYVAALLGLSHLQGNEPHRRTGLYRKLKNRGMTVRWFQSHNREGRTKFAVLKY